MLEDYLDHYKLSGDILTTLNMVREGQGTFLLRSPVLVKRSKRVECVQESEAMEQFLSFLEAAGGNIILVSLPPSSTHAMASPPVPRSVWMKTLHCGLTGGWVIKTCHIFCSVQWWVWPLDNVMVTLSQGLIHHCTLEKTWQI